jgi:hypothetical protein
LALALAAGPAGADVMPAAASDAGLVGVIPGVMSFLAWGPVLLLVLWSCASLLWLIEADRRRTRRRTPRSERSGLARKLMRHAV